MSWLSSRAFFRRLSERESELVVAEEVRLSGLKTLGGVVEEAAEEETCPEPVQYSESF